MRVLCVCLFVYVRDLLVLCLFLVFVFVCFVLDVIVCFVCVRFVCVVCLCLFRMFGCCWFVVYSVFVPLHVCLCWFVFVFFANAR